MMETKMIPGLSAVIIGRNEGERLEKCLQSVQAMQHPAIEIIYVDSASTDRSVEIARHYGAKVIEVRPERPTAALGRNAGWKHASSEYVLFLDGDTVVDPAFTAAALREFLQEESIAIVWGHRREIHPERSVYNRVLDLDWIYRPGFTDFCGGDALVRRDVLEKAGGFDERLIAGEEPEMCRRIRALGYKILHIDHPMTGHDLAMTSWRQYWRRATRAGYAYAEVSARFRNSGLPFWEDEVRRNRNRAVLLLALGITGVLFSITFLSAWPWIATYAIFLLLALRSAWKARWKSSDWPTLLLYGIHSHIQQLPIFVGQLQYLHDRRLGRKRGLIEYKTAASDQRGGCA
jgi:glycosyltransferase involved in cell wall biosynthesis